MVNVVKAETYSCDNCMRIYWSTERAEICEKSHNDDVPKQEGVIDGK